MKKIIAIDFDGVLFTEAYPAVGMPIAPNINRAKNERANGAVLILWTCREGKELADAVAACKAVGLEFDYVNENAAELKEAFGTDPRKIAATEYWDDKKCVHGALFMNDMVNVVRCRYCEFWTGNAGNEYGGCRAWSQNIEHPEAIVKFDGFCNFAVKKD